MDRKVERNSERGEKREGGGRVTCKEKGEERVVDRDKGREKGTEREK